MSVLISVKDLSVGWDASPVLEHASFEVEDGEVFAILGRSGSGKSTLFRCLVGLEEPLAGSIDLRGVGAPRLESGRPSFGVMFQGGALFGDMSVAENVALPIERWTKLPRPAIAAMARGKLRLVGLEAAEDKLPSELSGGMVKRAAIARAMALEPSLLFLDEPASGLDPVTAAELDALMVTLRRSLGVTVVLVTHDLGSIVGIVDRAVILDQAEKRIIGTGSPAELKESQDPRIHAFFARTVEPANVDKAEKS
jgi:phospholipid/cholesterol/gamma-HCH transport system ATP-binding protein